MRKNQSAHDIANTARLDRRLFKGSILIIEGSTDYLFFQKFINKEKCRIIISFNKDTAIQAILLLEKSGFPGVLAIVDKDFWAVDGISSPSKNVLSTDAHDQEAMIINSAGLDRLLEELSSKDRIAALPRSLRATLIDLASPIGYLRWVSNKENLCLKLRDIDMSVFIDFGTLSMNLIKFITEALKSSPKCTVGADIITGKLARVLGSGYDPWQICSGHDMSKILFIGLRMNFGNDRVRGMGIGLFYSLLRLSYEERDFRLTQLYKSLVEWQAENSGYSVF